MSRIKIIGCGNLLAYDEGVGIHVARRLKNEILPQNVDVLELRNPGQLLTELVRGAEKLIIIDAYPYQGKAGSIYHFTRKEGYFKKILTNTIHAHHFYAVFESRDKNIETFPQLPAEIVIIAIEIEKKQRFSVGLSKSVFSCLEEVIGKVLEELY